MAASSPEGLPVGAVELIERDLDRRGVAAQGLHRVFGKQRGEQIDQLLFGATRIVPVVRRRLPGLLRSLLPQIESCLTGCQRGLLVRKIDLLPVLLLFRRIGRGIRGIRRRFCGRLLQGICCGHNRSGGRPLRGNRLGCGFRASGIRLSAYARGGRTISRTLLPGQRLTRGSGLVGRRSGIRRAGRRSGIGRPCGFGG